ncbi:MAG: anthranilate synthase component I family protein [Saprospiraceae bacterium]
MNTSMETMRPIKKTKIKCLSKKYLADMNTPVSIYLKLRDHFGSTVLLESTDFSSKENCFSFIGADPIASFKVQDGSLSIQLPNEQAQTEQLVNTQSVAQRFMDFIDQFDIEHAGDYRGTNGFFGHTNFDAVQYFDTLDFPTDKRKTDLPDMHYMLYRYVIAINHFKDELYIIENLPKDTTSEMEKIATLIHRQNVGLYQFSLDGEEKSNLEDEAFRELVRVGKKHCQIGDVFQIVFSRQFSQKFKGDEFSVYRILRSVNPSPYLFYFDYGNYKIFGSSPEAQMVIKDRVASVNPIAGTYLRTGNDEEDQKRAKQLALDPKENAEHIMLVDLARNDLGRHSKTVQVKKLKEIQFFSHVIHLVSKVDGELENDANPIQIFGDTFPAGTLSGAPKYKAIQLINQYENQNRSTYGGAIGCIDFNGDMNQAIVIRSFLSKDNTLFYQAGAGIVVSSDEESELQEVNNKLAALRSALLKAENI